MTDSTPFRVLMVLNTYQYGGAERYTVSLAKGLRNRDVDVRVVCPTRGGLRENLLLNGIKTYDLDLGLKIGRYRGLEIFFPRVSIYASHRLREFLTKCYKEWKFDLIHLQFLMEKFFGTPIAVRMNIPVVWTMHGALPGWYRFNPRLRKLYKKSGNMAKKIICVSEAARRFETDNIGIDKNRTCVVHNGIELSTFVNARIKDDALLKSLNLTPDDFIVGIICQVYKQKGHDILVQAIRSAVKKNNKIKCLVVGTGPYLETMKRKVKQHKLDAVFRFTGFRKDVQELTGVSDVIISPSRSKSEGMPLRLIESMATGIPVIATDVGGTQEAFTDKEEGWILPPNRPGLLASILLNVSKDKDALLSAGKKAKIRAVSEFDVNIMVDKTLEIFKNSLKL